MVSDPSIFRSARDFAAWIGLVPRQARLGGNLQTRQRQSSIPAYRRRRSGDVPLETLAKRPLALSAPSPQAGDRRGGSVGQQDPPRGLDRHAVRRRLAAGRAAIFFPTHHSGAGGDQPHTFFASPAEGSQ
jgi:hypothetical protein